MIKDFKREVFEWGDQLEVEPKEIHVRKMSKKWASCSSKGRLTFSYELLNKSYPQRSKAIVHELLHLKYHTHNKMFKVLLTKHLEKKNLIASQIFL
jgi:hypothetical protein